jgi:hypothetical protein
VSDETTAFLAHIARERDRLAVTGDSTAAGPPCWFVRAGVPIYRVYKDGEAFTRLFCYATAPVRSEFDEAVFDVRELATWPDATLGVGDVGDAIRRALEAAIDAGELPL